MTQNICPRRSVLYVPGTNERALEKAKKLNVDVLIFDLEDSIAPQSKEIARNNVHEVVLNRDFGSSELIIRVNGIDTPWGQDDLNSAVAAKPDGILIPKVSLPGDVKSIEILFGNQLNHPNPPLWLMMETPHAMLNAGTVADCANETNKLTGFVMGTNDLVKETGVSASKGRYALLPWLMNCIAAAKANNLAIIDGVFNDFSDADGFRSECIQGMEIGMDGKTLIHPNQIEVCNEVFSPDVESVIWSQKIIDAYNQPENSGQGVIQIEGKMVERLHLEIAERIVKIADLIKQQDAQAN